MAKFTAELDTAEKMALLSGAGTHIWKIGSNYVVVYRELSKVKYRYSVDTITWTERVLVDESASGNPTDDVATWYQSISGSDILYVVWKYNSITMNIGKWNINTIGSPSQIGSTYNLTTGISWSPTWHHKITVATDNKIWITGMTWQVGGSNYHDYYTVKATNTMNNSDDSDINAWGTPLLIGTGNGGTDKEYGGVCILAGSTASSKMFFAYTTWTGATTMRLKYRWGDGGNAAGNWSPIPPAVGTDYGTLYSTDLATYTVWREGTTLRYAPSGMPGLVWLALVASGGFYIARFNLETQTLHYSKLVLAASSQKIGLCVVSYGGFDVVHTMFDVTYAHIVSDEQGGGLGTGTTLDTTGWAYHRFISMPLTMVDQGDVMVMYTEA